MNAATANFSRFYRAFLRGDPLDARTVVAVRTTGIYCLLSCRARKPRPENISFYPSSGAAERHGFRPCRKCRPEVRGGRTALERARVRKWLDELAQDEVRVGRLAAASGASPSRIYRAFRRQLGRGPRQARGEERLRRACALLREGGQSVTAVAYDAGFSSLSTFYRWFRRRMGTTPSAYRKTSSSRRKE